jgi:hypothetical protein
MAKAERHGRFPGLAGVMVHHLNANANANGRRALWRVKGRVPFERKPSGVGSYPRGLV